MGRGRRLHGARSALSAPPPNCMQYLASSTKQAPCIEGVTFRHSRSGTCCRTMRAACHVSQWTMSPSRHKAPPGGCGGAPPSQRLSPNAGTPVATWPTGFLSCHDSPYKRGPGCDYLTRYKTFRAASRCRYRANRAVRIVRTPQKSAGPYRDTPRQPGTDNAPSPTNRRQERTADAF